MTLTTYQQEFRVQGPDGQVLYIGAGKHKNPTEYLNSEASAVINAGEAVRIDSTHSILARLQNYAAGASIDADQPLTETLRMLRISAAANVGILGVALNSIAPLATVGAAGIGMFAGAGAILCVKCLASPTSTTLGAQCIGS